MKRLVFFAYGMVAWGGFLAAFLYLIGFLANIGVPKSIDSGQEGSVGASLAVNVLLLALFAVHHSVAARDTFKQWWTKVVPREIERSTYVLVADLLLVLILWQWRPMTGTVWHVEHEIGRAVLWGAFAVGWGLLVYSTFVIDHFDLFGARQVYRYLRGRPHTHPPFMVRSVYRFIRHPILLGWIIAFWSTPDMTAGHLVFAVGNTLYIFVGFKLEERTLSELLGDDYRRYLGRTPALVPMLGRRSA